MGKPVSHMLLIFVRFAFTPRLIPADETPAAVFAMFQGLGLVAKFRISRETLARFVLVRRLLAIEKQKREREHQFGRQMGGNGATTSPLGLSLSFVCASTSSRQNSHQDIFKTCYN